MVVWVPLLNSRVRASLFIKNIHPYGTTKLMIEDILRYFNPVGSHESGLIGEDDIIRIEDDFKRD
ncbi:MAG: hypothetical protein QM482_02330 [Sulfurospirillum sp.]